MKNSKVLAFRPLAIILTIGGLYWWGLYKILIGGVIPVPRETAWFILVGVGGITASGALIGARFAARLAPPTNVWAAFGQSIEILKHRPLGVGIGWMAIGAMAFPVFPNALAMSATGVCGAMLILWCHMGIERSLREKVGGERPGRV